MRTDLTAGQIQQRHADTYDWCGPLIREMVTGDYDPDTTEILDVGACWGKYRLLLPEYHQMDACEPWVPYVTEEDLPSMYRQVHVMDICDLVQAPAWQPYDLVIMGDVLEHIERSRAQLALAGILRACRDVIAVVPYLNEQGAEHGNPYQRHLQPDLTPELMATAYPALRLLDTEYRGGQPFKGLYRS